MAKSKTTKGKKLIKQADSGKKFEETATDLVKTGVKAVVAIGVMGAIGGAFKK